MKDYFEYIDLSKGVGICLVVLGHGLFPYHYAIDSFHMPLFFILAGMTYTLPSSDGLFLLKKIDRIFIPYIFFTTVSEICSFVLRTLNHGPLYGGSFNGPLWFLPAIFGSLILYLILNRKFRQWYQLNFIILLLFVYEGIVSYYGLDFLPFSFDTIIFSTVFVHVGYCIHKVIGSLSGIYTFLLMLLYCGGLLLAHEMEIDKGNYMNHSIYSSNILFYFFMALTGSCFLIKSCQLVAKFQNKLVKIVAWLGKNSLVIMCVHFPMIQILNLQIVKMNLYDNLFGRVLLGCGEFVLVLLLSVIVTILCKYFIPSLTGYKRLLSDIV